MATSRTSMDRAMLKVNSTSSKNGGIGSMTMASMTSSSSGMPRLPWRRPARLLRTSPMICVRSTATCLPQTIQSFDAKGVVTGLSQEAFQLCGQAATSLAGLLVAAQIRWNRQIRQRPRALALAGAELPELIDVGQHLGNRQIQTGRDFLVHFGG